MMCFDMIMRGSVSPGQVKSISAAIMSLMARASEAAQALSSFQKKNSTLLVTSNIRNIRIDT